MNNLPTCDTSVIHFCNLNKKTPENAGGLSGFKAPAGRP